MIGYTVMREVFKWLQICFHGANTFSLIRRTFGSREERGGATPGVFLGFVNAADAQKTFSTGARGPSVGKLIFALHLRHFYVPVYFVAIRKCARFLRIFPPRCVPRPHVAGDNMAYLAQHASSSSESGTGQGGRKGG